MAANQKAEDFQIEDWAIPEEELPWNAGAAARFQAPNVVCLEQYRRKRKPDTQGSR
jgi:hypothetical protein